MVGSEQPKSWNLVLPWAEYWYNTTYQGASKCTPFQTVYGRPPPTLTRYIPGETVVDAVTQDLQTRDEALKQLKYHLARAQDQMIHYANKKRVVVKIKEGPVAFWLQLPETSRIHPVFHVSQLKLAVGDHRVEEALPTELQEGRHMYIPLKVLQRKNQQQHGKEEHYICQQFYNFNLEDKVDVGERVILDH
ncbi:uncharacterized protein LOC108346548 [Vigna angularis]|uniref:uncharacterized protein LOC108346548 n=1 Tax=Phaseolus angularis TaxID=3914 RepID=UPI0022B2B8F7|nr:uncharacterized protein LOC108346548 [Vigna angularis]